MPAKGSRLTNEWIQAGVIGEVREVHVWSDRAGLLWKQGIGRPTRHAAGSLDARLEPVARPDRTSVRIIPPTRRRTGAAGEISAPAPWATWAATSSIIRSGRWASAHRRRSRPPCTLDGSVLGDDKPNFETYPIAVDHHLTNFPRAAQLPPVRMTWYEGGLMPPTPAEMPAGKRLPGNGVLYVGSKGKMYHCRTAACPSCCPWRCTNTRSRCPRPWPARPAITKNGCKPAREARDRVSNFDYAGPLTEIVLLGVLALRAPANAWSGTAPA